MWAGQSKWGKDMEPMGEINVTPLVDVMLVLLIIFMVTAPLLTQGVNVDLPDASSAAMQQNIEPLVITIRSNGDVFLQKKKVSLDSLTASILAIRKNKADVPIYIRGDAKTPYELIAKIMSQLEQAKINKVGLVTEPIR
ncbi:MAG: protein TolR [Mariprofundaceae bacterium]|nr:protein TolR [Mariprofundaceae bacterium]